MEDNPDDVKLTLKAFQRSKVVNPIDVAFDGVEALDYLECFGQHAKRNPAILPACILLDLKMPRTDGLELLQRIRTNVRWKLIPVVILTSSKKDEDRIEGYELGANSYVRKPVGLSRFMEAVERLSVYWLAINTPPFLEPRDRSFRAVGEGMPSGKAGTPGVGV